MSIDVVGLIANNQLQPGELRRIVRALAPPGTLKSGDLAVTQNGTPNMSVNIAAGEALIEGTESTSQGLYYFRNDAVENRTVSTASSSNPRKDIVVARIYDQEFSGSTDVGTLEVIPGTPAASPTAPATPANSIKLAEITVGQSATSVVNANLSSSRFRSQDVQHQFLVNDSAVTGIIGTVNVFDGTVTIPEGWVEYDVRIHGKMVYEVQNAAGVQSRFTTLSQAPSGTTRNEGRVTLLGEASGVSVFDTDPIDVVVTGLTGNLSFRYQSSVTRGGGGNVTRRLVVATMNRVR